MRKSRVFFMLMATFALSLPAMSQNAHHDPHVFVAHDHHDICHAHDDRDHCALAEMHGFAAHHYANAHVHPETFGRVAHWSHDWELRWVDYEIDGSLVRLYHLTNKSHPEQRYLALWDHTHGHDAHWERVR